MHPAYSVIVFTTASGAGYGLLILASAFALTGLIPAERWLGLAIFACAFGLVTLGLLSSTFHLGRPERAWRAFSQWRTSWLSREGVMAVATYIPAGLFALGWVLFETAASPWSIAGWLSIIAALVTVWCTGMIYASLPTIRQWHHPLVAPNYVLMGLATGAVFLNAILQLFSEPADISSLIALILLIVAFAAKWGYWRSIDAAEKSYTAEQATGLGSIGKVRPLEPPHTQPNYVMREMGYEVARRHALRLRFLSALLGFAVPVAATGLIPTSDEVWSFLLALVALVCAAIGILIERWLFFAEAQHVVTLYYGAETA